MHFPYLSHFLPALQTTRRIFDIKVSTSSALKLGSLILTWKSHITTVVVGELNLPQSPFPSSCWTLGLSAVGYRRKFKIIFH